MRIIHRVTFSHKDGVDRILDGSGIKYKKVPLPGSSHIVVLEMDESHACWEQVAELIQDKRASDIVWTAFTKKELLDAQWLRLVPTFEQGYPQPEGTWAGSRSNYEELCPECGTFRQVSSFRLKNEPRLGKNDFVSLFGTYALFCTPRVVSTLEACGIQGYELWDAIVDGTGLCSETVSQLSIRNIAHPGLSRADEMDRKTCASCGVTKYYPHVRGLMYLDCNALVPGIDIVQSYEWFGSGRAAYREILVSNALARLVIEKGWKGVALKAVQLT